MNIIAILCDEFEVSTAIAERIVTLIDEGNTIPFIARYRKEQTGAMDDQKLRSLSERLEYLRNLNQRYDDFINNKYRGRVMVIDKDNLDFEHNAKDFARIADRIDQTLFGLFSNPTPNTPCTSQ